MTFQIVLISALEEGPVRSHTVRLPNAYETFACARKVACYMLDNYWADDARIVVWGTNDPANDPSVWVDPTINDDLSF
jgi:hypothetical protein